MKTKNTKTNTHSQIIQPNELIRDISPEECESIKGGEWVMVNYEWVWIGVKADRKQETVNFK